MIHQQTWGSIWIYVTIFFWGAIRKKTGLPCEKMDEHGDSQGDVRPIFRQTHTKGGERPFGSAFLGTATTLQNTGNC